VDAFVLASLAEAREGSAEDEDVSVGYKQETNSSQNPVILGAY
jgi:hypothetical protein